jgi:hypothetical protein
LSATTPLANESDTAEALTDELADFLGGETIMPAQTDRASSNAAASSDDLE